MNTNYFGHSVVSSKIADELRYIPGKAVSIKNSLGIKSAAGFLRNNGFSFESSLWILLRIESR